MLHLANARQALIAGDIEEAVREVDAAIAIDRYFVPAQALREEIAMKLRAGARGIPAPIRRAQPLARRRLSRLRRSWPLAAGLAMLAVGSIAVVHYAGAQCDDGCTAASIAPTPDPTFVVTPVFVARPPAAELPDSSLEWTSSRLAQLGVRPLWRASALHVDDPALLRDLGEAVSELWVGTTTDNEDAIFVGDDVEWTTLRAPLKRTGVVWRIYARRLADEADSVRDLAAAAGFVRVRRVRYSTDYMAEQFAPRALAR